MLHLHPVHEEGAAILHLDCTSLFLDYRAEKLNEQPDLDEQKMGRDWGKGGKLTKEYSMPP